jgi:hypothetical protein
MADEKGHTQQGQIERAQRLRKAIQELKEGRPADKPSPGNKSIKEQIDERMTEKERDTKH